MSRLTFTDIRNDKRRVPTLRQKEALQVLAHASVLHPGDELVDDGADVPGTGIEGVDIAEHVGDEVGPRGVSASVKLGAGGSALHGIVRVAGCDERSGERNDELVYNVVNVVNVLNARRFAPRLVSSSLCLTSSFLPVAPFRS